MNIGRMREAFERATTTDRWALFVGAMDEWEAELATADPATAERPLLDLQSSLCSRLIEARRAATFSLHIAAELVPGIAVDFRRLRETEALLWQSDDPAQRYLANVMTAQTRAVLTSDRAEVPWLWPAPKRLDAQAWLADVLPRYAVRSQVQPPVLPPVESIRTLPGLLPGDCIFRRQSPSFPVNPFRDFGHAGLYIGCTDPAADADDCANHLIVHVVSATPACQIDSLHAFCHPGGKRESFWGAYRANLTPRERQQLILDAVSCAGRGTYAFRSAYKNRAAMTFRCDGFVEDCHERINPSLQPLKYRGGLFEDDRWKTLNPSALRNCLTGKITDRIAPCCLP